MKFIFYYDTIIGRLGIVASENGIHNITFENQNGIYNCKELTIMKQAAMQLHEYLNGKRFHFDLPIVIEGTEFEVAVWNQLLKIPYGEILSYKDIACAIGKPGAYRAVGMANHKNRLPIVLPCHRVIGSNGKLIGYAGGLTIKEKLLSIEKEHQCASTQMFK